jgi:hypothetical protein
MSSPARRPARYGASGLAPPVRAADCLLVVRAHRHGRHLDDRELRALPESGAVPGCWDRERLNRRSGHRASLLGRRAFSPRVFDPCETVLTAVPPNRCVEVGCDLTEAVQHRAPQLPQIRPRTSVFFAWNSSSVSTPVSRKWASFSICSKGSRVGRLCGGDGGAPLGCVATFTAIGTRS